MHLEHFHEEIVSNDFGLQSLMDFCHNDKGNACLEKHLNPAKISIYTPVVKMIHPFASVRYEIGAL